MKRRCIWLWIVLLLLLLGMEANAAEQMEVEEAKGQILSQLELENIDAQIHALFPEEKVGFYETVRQLISGETKVSADLFKGLVSDRLFAEFSFHRKALVQIVLLALAAAVFANLSGVFHSRQISEMSFYMVYLLLITICLNSFQVAVNGLGEKLSALTEFMRILSPAYFLAVAIAKGSSSAVVFYNLILVLIYLVELLVLQVVLPLVHICIVMKLLNQLSGEAYLSKFAELLETVVSWTMKTLLAAVVGLNLVQGLLHPALDSLKRSALTKGAEALPVIGDALGGAAELFLGTAVLIKNGIGVAGAVFCVAICLAPLVQMGVMTFLYKLVAALLQPVCDKRVVGCVGAIGDGGRLLLRILVTTGLLFLLSIALVAATTN